MLNFTNLSHFKTRSLSLALVTQTSCAAISFFYWSTQYIFRGSIFFLFLCCHLKMTFLPFFSCTKRDDSIQEKKHQYI